MPAAAALVAVAMSAAAGCVSVSPHDDDRSARPPRLTRAAGPEAAPGPARESLTTTGDGPERGRAATLGRPSDASADLTDPPLVLTGEPSWAPSWGPRPSWPPGWPLWGREHDRAGGATGSHDRESGEPAREADRPAGSARSAGPPPPAAAPPSREAAHEAPGPRREAPPPPAERQADQESRPRHEPEARHEAPAPAPAAPAPRGRKGNGVCAMGDTYGKWQKGGDASRICHQVYGN
ncbi:hypothetical protein [Streptomyces cinnamoneus]|uniref:Lipoprotein n=1 Tax=Streptomyces cinnamoneus TaxID=53446 RepID=A0A918WHV5_STRCJ|nr:hypothetical protein [Streptomyces cinnamoneus]GHC47666.1 hypothetical protein GCM10010507_24030 [Streptomyces cinnamoneus]